MTSSTERPIPRFIDQFGFREPPGDEGYWLELFGRTSDDEPERPRLNWRMWFTADDELAEVAVAGEVDGCGVVAWLSPEGGTTQLLVTGGPEDAAHNSQWFRRFGLGAFYDELADDLAGTKVPAHLPESWGSFKVERPGRKGRPDDYYALWVFRYLEAVEEDPRRPVQWMARTYADEGRSESAIQALLTKAAGDRAIWTRRGHGVTGGMLTPKGEELMEVIRRREEGIAAEPYGRCQTQYGRRLAEERRGG